MPRRCERRTLPIELIPHDEYVSLDQKDILGGTRTLNLEIRSLTPYPLGHEDTAVSVHRALFRGRDGCCVVQEMF